MRNAPTIEKIRARKGSGASRRSVTPKTPSWDTLRDKASRARPWRLTDRWASDDRASLVPADAGSLDDPDDDPSGLTAEEEAAIRVMRQLGESFGGEPLYACLAALPLKLAAVTACLAMVDDESARALVRSYLDGEAGIHRTSVRAAWRVRECIGLVGPSQSV
jgi:hypothetical protein